MRGLRRDPQCSMLCVGLSVYAWRVTVFVKFHSVAFAKRLIFSLISVYFTRDARLHSKNRNRHNKYHVVYVCIKPVLLLLVY